MKKLESKITGAVYGFAIGDQHEHLIGGEMEVIELEYKFINDIEVLFVKIKQK